MDKATTERLGKAVEARNSNQAFMATSKEMAVLEKDKLVESNANIKEGEKIAFRATDAGMKAFAEATGGSGQAPQQQPQMSEDAGKYEIEEGIPVPEGGRRTGPKMKYPFDRLNVGQSFFVEATDDKPEPWKSLASTVSTATRRYAVENGKRTDRNGNEVTNYTPTRRFRLDKARRNPNDENSPMGARVWRTA